MLQKSQSKMQKNYLLDFDVAENVITYAKICKCLHICAYVSLFDIWIFAKYVMHPAYVQ